MGDESGTGGRDLIFSPDGGILSDNSLHRLKRLRNNQWSDNDADAEDGFIPVERRSKRQYNKNGGQRSYLNETSELCEISMTSSEPLPKQMALAKLLKSLDIKDIIKIKYKSSYKVIFTFESTLKADLLLQCQELQNRGFKCQKTNELNTRYGIVKKVDLEFTVEELQKIFTSEIEIISVWRLKRQTTEGTWVECETVRLCFKGNTVPPYVVAYGCRFIVEPYIFPVSQCSGCWRYGHRVKFCPIKKLFCPKCGANHANCETLEFKCINCKGSHMSVEKSKCPAFQKEKEIRAIMRDENCTYKNAFEMFQEIENITRVEEPIPTVTVDPINITRDGNRKLTTNTGDYREALLTKKIPVPKHDEKTNNLLGKDTKNDWQEVTKNRKKRIRKIQKSRTPSENQKVERN